MPSDASIDNRAFDDNVTITKGGIPYNSKEANNAESNSKNSTTAQISTVQQGWHKDGEHWNWLRDGTKRTGWYTENGEWYYF